jgi:hypothetical protein
MPLVLAWGISLKTAPGSEICESMSHNPYGLRKVLRRTKAPKMIIIPAELSDAMVT